MPGVECVRQFERLDKLQGAPRQTLLLCGLDSHSFATASETLDTKALAGSPPKAEGLSLP